MLLGGANAFTRPTNNVAASSRQSFLQLQPQMLSELAESYNALNEGHPFLTPMATASTLSGLGDVLAQLRSTNDQAEEQEKGQEALPAIDWQRTQRFMIKGFGAGLIWSGWFQLVEDWTNQLMDQGLQLHLDSDTQEAQEYSPASIVIGKTVISILLEQFIAAPLIYTFWDIPVPMLLCEEDSKEEIPSQITATLPGLLVDNAKVWTFVSTRILSMFIDYSSIDYSNCHLLTTPHNE